MRKVIFSVALTVLALGVALSPVAAATFDFNSLTDSSTNTSTSANNDPLDNYMTTAYGSQVTVDAGARAIAAVPNPGNPALGSYGQNPDLYGSNTVGLYLGNSDGITSHVGTLDTYLINCWEPSTVSGCTSGNQTDRIKISFVTKPIASVAFDFEIFPQLNTPSDFTLFADGIQIFNVTLDGTGGTNVQAGLLAKYNTIFATPVTTLEFVDWNTAPVGIDNLVVDTFVPPGGDLVPEPSTLLLLGAGLVGLAARQRRARAARNRGI